MCASIACTDGGHVGASPPHRDSAWCGARVMTRAGHGLVRAASERCGAMASSASPRQAAACTRPSSLDAAKMPSCSLANSRWQLSRILSNTGARVGHRAADDLQHLGGGGLPLQRFLRLVEQPHVLDRDHGLVGEGLQQRDLLVAELDAGCACVTEIAPMPCPSRIIGTNSGRAEATGAGSCRVKSRRVGRMRVGEPRSVRRSGCPADGERSGSSWQRVHRLGMRASPRSRRHRRANAASRPQHRGRGRPVARTARAALCTMASNTGCTSVGELLITSRISAVAVCRSSASLVSLNSRTFSIAITAWSAKVLQQLHVMVGRRARRRPRDRDHAEHGAVAHQRARTACAR